ncbi:MAG: WbqC family protein [Bacteroidales bacterium]|nr:WbqC family protein [Bacteroidales bacterium]
MTLSHPLLRHEGTVLLPPMLAAPISYYATMAMWPQAVIDVAMPYDKRQKTTHRYDIVDTRGRLSLTVPITHPDHWRGSRWTDVLVSGHGDWWAPHLSALESAYGRTPFFEFYADRFVPLLSSEWVGRGLMELVKAWDAEIRRILMLPTRVGYEVPSASVAPLSDYRRSPLPVKAEAAYYQVRQARLGFVAGLSVLDLIFNLGPEAPLYIQGLLPSCEAG